MRITRKKSPLVGEYNIEGQPLESVGGDMGVYGIAVLSFFSSGISVILILMCGIAVSSSRAVCDLSSFWLNGIR